MNDNDNPAQKPEKKPVTETPSGTIPQEAQPVLDQDERDLAEAIAAGFPSGREPEPEGVPATEEATNPDAQPADTPAADPATGAPEVDAKKDATAARIKELEALISEKTAELRKRDGQYGGELTKLRDQLEAKERQMADLLEREQSRKALEAAAESEVDEELMQQCLGPDYKETYGEPFIKGISKLVNVLAAKNSHADTAKIVGEKLAEIRTKDHEERLWSEVEKTVPGARKMNAEAAACGLDAYLDGTIGDTGIVRRDVANEAYAAVVNGADGDVRERHLRTLGSIFKGFAEQGKVPVVQDPSKLSAGSPDPAQTPKKKPDPAKYAMPATSAADGAVPTAGGTIPMSEVDKLLEKAAKDGNLREAGAALMRQAMSGRVQ